MVKKMSSRIRPTSWSQLADSYDKLVTEVERLRLAKLPKRQLEARLTDLLETEALPMLRRIGRRPSKLDGD